MDNQHHTIECASDVEIKEELVESCDEKEVLQGIDDPLEPTDENSSGDDAVKNQAKEDDVSFMGEKRKGGWPVSNGACGVGESGMWLCRVCLVAFITKSRLAQHTRAAHPGEKPFECGVCRRRFARQPTLTRHLRLHTGEKPFECLTCGRFFAQFSSLRAHVRTHSEERPHACDTCGKRFSQKGSLATHAITHSGEWRFGCRRCHKGFAHRSHYQLHMRTHTGEKPFECATCGKKFAFKGNLAQHVQMHNKVATTTRAAAATTAAENEDDPVS